MINITENNYNEFIEYLYSLSDIKYREFHSKITMDNTLIGIRTPKLKEIAKELVKTNNYQNFIKYSNFETYEERIIYGLVIGHLKCDFNEQLEFLNNFIPLINNWAINDIICANLKSFKRNQQEGYKYIKNCLQSNNPWQIRVGLVLLLDFYINDKYIDKILQICNNINNNEYYVKMANAWLISIFYIKYKDKTKNFLENNKLDKWTQNKAIQKIIESKRVAKEEKDKLKLLKR